MMEYIPRGNRYPSSNKHGVLRRSLQRSFQIRSDSEQLSVRVRSDLCIGEFLLTNTEWLSLLNYPPRRRELFLDQTLNSLFHLSVSLKEHEWQCTMYNVQWGAFVQQLLQWKSNKYYIFWVWVCSLSYPARNTHAPYCHLWPLRFYHILHIIS